MNIVDSFECNYLGNKLYFLHPIGGYPLLGLVGQNKPTDIFISSSLNILIIHYSSFEQGT
jgi:hypothetical protein